MKFPLLTSLFSLSFGLSAQADPLCESVNQNQLAGAQAALAAGASHGSGDQILAAVKVLVGAGANVNHAGRRGYTPLCLNRIYKVAGVDNILLANGATLGSCPF